jgi:hypothetical protein
MLLCLNFAVSFTMQQKKLPTSSTSQLNFQNGIIVISEFYLTSNQNVVKVNYSLHNDGIHTYSLDFTLDIQTVITKLLVYISIRVPENDHDEKYQKMVLRTVVDVERALIGTNRNVLIKKLVEGLAKNNLNDLKFPLVKVSRRNYDYGH